MSECVSEVKSEKTADSRRTKCVANFFYQTLLLDVIHLVGQNSRVDTQQKLLLLLFIFRSPSLPAPDLFLQQHYTDVYTKHTSVSVSSPSPWQHAGPVYFRRAPHTHFSFSPSPISPTCRLLKRRRETEREEREGKMVPHKNNRINSGCKPIRTSSKPLESSRRRPVALLHCTLCVRPQLV